MMNCNELKDEMLNSIVNAKAWDEISLEFNLTGEMLEHYVDKLNWKLVSRNSNIQWTVRLVEKWADRLNWEELSYCDNKYLLTPDVIAYFINRWNWLKLSGNTSIVLDNLFIDRFVDRWDWSELIGRYRDGIFSTKFYERYKKYIPVNDFLDDSHLLRAMQDEALERIKEELTKQC